MPTGSCAPARLHPKDSDVILGGTQDNGVVLTSGGQIWNGIITGDGLNCVLGNDQSVLFTMLGGFTIRTRLAGSFVDWNTFQVGFDPSCSHPKADG